VASGCSACVPLCVPAGRSVTSGQLAGGWNPSPKEPSTLKQQGPEIVFDFRLLKAQHFKKQHSEAR
jgi:hypothetical protein